MFNYKIKRIFILCTLSIVCSASFAKSLTHYEERALAESIFIKTDGKKASYGDVESFIEYELLRLSAHAKLQHDFPLKVTVIQSPIPNAFAWTANYLYIYSAMFQKCPKIEGLLSIMSHELTHSHRHHVSRKLEKREESFTKDLLAAATIPLAIALPGLGQFLFSVQQDLSYLSEMKFSQTMEFEADQGALLLMSHGGYDPHSVYKSFEVFRENESVSQSQSFLNYYYTHPLTSARIARMKSELIKMPNNIDHHMISDRQSDMVFIKASINANITQWDLLDDQERDLFKNYIEAKSNEKLDQLFVDYPNSLLLRFNILEQYKNQEKWHELGAFLANYEHDPIWNTLNKVKGYKALSYFHTHSAREFVRKYQEELFLENPSSDILKLLVDSYEQSSNKHFEKLASIKYHLAQKNYQVALNFLNADKFYQHDQYTLKLYDEADQLNKLVKYFSYMLGLGFWSKPPTCECMHVHQNNQSK